MSLAAAPQTWIPDDQTLGARLALVRQRFGWNMKEAALACSIAQGSWREWELRDRVPRDYPQMMQRIADRTGVDLLWLMTGRSAGTGPAPDTPGAVPDNPCPRWDSNPQPTDARRRTSALGGAFGTVIPLQTAA